MNSSDLKIFGALFTSITAILVAAIQAGATSHKVDAVTSSLNEIQVVGGTMDARENMVFGDIPPGRADLPSNWKEWSRRVSFEHDGSNIGKPFSRPPKVFVSLKSLDASNLADTGPRLSLSAPEREVDRDGFTLHIYTWADEQAGFMLRRGSKSPGWLSQVLNSDQPLGTARPDPTKWDTPLA